jgi:hypothetical protein
MRTITRMTWKLREFHGKQQRQQKNSFLGDKHSELVEITQIIDCIVNM